MLTFFEPCIHSHYHSVYLYFLIINFIHLHYLRQRTKVSFQFFAFLFSSLSLLLHFHVLLRWVFWKGFAHQLVLILPHLKDFCRMTFNFTIKSFWNVSPFTCLAFSSSNCSAVRSPSLRTTTVGSSSSLSLPSSSKSWWSYFKKKSISSDFKEINIYVICSNIFFWALAIFMLVISKREY